MLIGSKNTNSNNPISTHNATSIKVGTPDGIKAANVPPRMIAAEITTVPIMSQASHL